MRGALLRIKETKKYPRYKRATKKEVMLYYPYEIDLLKMSGFLYSNILNPLKESNVITIDDIANFLLKNDEDINFMLTTTLNRVINCYYEIDLSSKEIKYASFITRGEKIDLKKCIPMKFNQYYS